MNDLIKRSLPHVIAVVVFVITTIAFYSPLFFQNQEIYQNDVLQGVSSASEIIAFRENTGEEALWTNAMFGGMPAYLINVKWSTVIPTVQQVISLFLPSPAGTTFLACLCFYILLIAFGVNPYLAIAGGLAFGLNTFNIISIEAGHMWKVRAIAYMPLVLAGIHLCLSRKNMLLGSALAALGTALELQANHLQITYYLFFVIVGYGLVQVFFYIKEKQARLLIKPVALLLVAGALGVFSNLGKIWSAYEYGQYSIRGKSDLTSNKQSSGGLDRDYAFYYSSGVSESLTFLIPSFMGGASVQPLDRDSELGQSLRRNGAPPQQQRQLTQQARTYWGDQPAVAGPIYGGVIVLFLFVLGIFFVETKYRVWLIAIGAISIMLSWGKNFSSFNYLIFDVLPGYDKFRAVSMTVSITLLVLPLLGFLALDQVLKGPLAGTNQKRFLYAVGITAGLSAIIALLGSSIFSFRGAADAQLPDWYQQAIVLDRQSLQRADAWRSTFLILAFSAVIWFHLKGRINQTITFVVLGALVLIDLWGVDRRYINDENFQRRPEQTFAQQNEADEVILADGDLQYRVLNLQNPFNEARTSAFHKSIGGYHGAKMRRYQELIENKLSAEMQRLIEGLQNGQRAFEDLHTLNMLNTKYFVAGPQRNAVIRNDASLGAAWFANQVISVGSADEEIAQLGTVDSGTTAIVNSTNFQLSDFGYDPNARIDIVEYQPNYLKYEYQSTDPSFAVFSEIYYPVGWQAYVDGVPVPHVQTNYVLRGMVVPAGSHTVEFRFAPRVYTAGNPIVFISSVLVLLWIVGALGWTVKGILSK
ncbi:MAG: YfhO family protein [Bacteroidota bacterium]